MTLAARLDGYLTRRAQREAAATAARATRDAFIQAQFPLLNQRLIDLVTAAVGQHSRLTLAATALTETVTGRSFASLAKTALEVRADLDGGLQTIAFTPRLAFGDEAQFGVVACTASFAFTPRARNADRMAALLLAEKLQMRGTGVAALMLAAPDGFIEAGATLFEEALAALLLRGAG
jgi:hypothetical protein